MPQLGTDARAALLSGSVREPPSLPGGTAEQSRGVPPKAPRCRMKSKLPSPPPRERLLPFPRLCRNLEFSYLSPPCGLRSEGKNLRKPGLSGDRRGMATPAAPHGRRAAASRCCGRGWVHSPARANRRALAATHAPARARAGPGSDSTVRGPLSGQAGAARSELREPPGLCAESTAAADPESKGTRGRHPR